jgi:hypothetical protein
MTLIVFKISITEEHCEFVRELIAEDCTISLEDLQERFQAATELEVSTSTIQNAIIGFIIALR